MPVAFTVAAEVKWRSTKLEELAEKKAAIEAEMEQLKKDQRDADLKKVKELCKLHGFTAGMLKGALAPGRKKK